MHFVWLLILIKWNLYDFIRNNRKYVTNPRVSSSGHELDMRSLPQWWFGEVMGLILSIPLGFIYIIIANSLPYLLSMDHGAVLRAFSARISLKKEKILILGAPLNDILIKLKMRINCMGMHEGWQMDSFMQIKYCFMFLNCVSGVGFLWRRWELVRVLVSWFSPCSLG